MKILTSTTLLIALLLIIGCDAVSDPSLASSTTTLQILHSNDIVGYLKPCG
jgi:hypothetical protein